MLISRRAEVRLSAVLWSSGTGLPSAVDAASEVDEVLGDWNRNENGRKAFFDARGSNLSVGGAEDIDVPEGLSDINCGGRCVVSPVEFMDRGVGNDDKDGIGNVGCEEDGL
jgi:hypothetical protein